ncbi:MAG: helix-turn-helix domain-containing protein [Actinomycetota bacterium]|nr:helix-turn-helix domain-containing protein [Actinomycetota bacterium]
MAAKTLPAPVKRAMSQLGDDLATWRRLRNLTVAQVAERADVARGVVVKLEAGGGTTFESVLRVARALGVLDSLATSLDPYRTDVGRLRSEEVLPQRVRHRAIPKPDEP